MAEFDISYAVVAERYPFQVDEILGKLRKGKSKVRNLPAEELTWKFSAAFIALVGRAETFPEALSGRAAERRQVQERQRAAMTFEQRVAAHLQHYHVTLKASGGSWWGVAGDNPVFVGTLAANARREAGGEFPQELRAWVEINLREELAEEARIAAMTPEQRQQEANAAIQELSRGTGFAAFNIRRTP